jgi:ATP phosphoribosyltransferase
MLVATSKQDLEPTADKPRSSDALIQLALPKGRMQQGVVALLAEAGIDAHFPARSYRPKLSLEGVDTKLLKPQNIVEMLDLGSRDVGFAGADWVAELGANLVELLDTELDPVKVVAAAPAMLVEDGKLPSRRLVIASEYQRLTQSWIERQELDATLLRSYGATEVFPPEDADLIVDNTATGSTLKENGLVIVDQLMTSSTRLYASPRAMDNPDKREAIEQLVLLLRSVLDARRRVMVELNVDEAALAGIVEVMPCMREPTISPLLSAGGYAVKAAVPRIGLPKLVVELKTRGATDIVVTKLTQIIA